jgi:hypothetical protein
MSAKNAGRWAAGITAILLAGILTDRLLLHRSSQEKNLEPYQQHVREAATAMPRQIGRWVGEDIAITHPAVALLKDNVVFSRSYHEVGSDRCVRFMFVQCCDLRDLQGHWPPACYSVQGWLQSAAAPGAWDVDGLHIDGMQYDFVRDRLDRLSLLAVDNFMILPDGRTCGDVQSVQQVAKDPGKRVFGAAQVQVVTDGTLSPEDRRNLTQTMIHAHSSLISAVLHGESK